MTYTEAYRRARYSPEHWNQNAACTIPAAWEIRNDSGWVIADGETREDAADIAASQ